MEKSVTLSLPKKDVEALLRILEDLRLISEAERGDAEINKGKYVTLKQLKKR